MNHEWDERWKCSQHWMRKKNKNKNNNFLLPLFMWDVSVQQPDRSLHFVHEASSTSYASWEAEINLAEADSLAT